MDTQLARQVEELIQRRWKQLFGAAPRRFDVRGIDTPPPAWDLHLRPLPRQRCLAPRAWGPSDAPARLFPFQHCACQSMGQEGRRSVAGDT
jgi:hypothetical protein